MAKRNSSKKTSCSNCGITGCSPQCPFFPNTDGETKWHIGEDGLKHRDEPLMKCGYNGSPITSWSRICPWKEDKRNLLLEKKKQEKPMKPREMQKRSHLKRNPIEERKRIKAKLKKTKNNILLTFL